MKGFTVSKDLEHNGLPPSFDEWCDGSRKRLLDWCTENGYTALDYRVPRFAEAFIDYSGPNAHMWLEKCTIANQPKYKCPIVARIAQ